MDILKIRKKRMADLADERRDPSSTARAARPTEQSSTTRALLGDDALVFSTEPAPIERAPFSYEEIAEAGAQAMDDAAARDPKEPISRIGRSDRTLEDDTDPLMGFLARLDVLSRGSAWRDVAEPTQTEASRFLIFDLGPESYAANIIDIREIIKVSTVTSVPRAPEGVLGVISKRGVVMPVVDLAAALHLRPVRRELLPDQRVLVSGDGDDVVGLRVDRVHGVSPIGLDELGPIPSGVSTSSAAFFRGLAQRPDGMCIVIDLAAFREHLTFMANEGSKA
jgi:purine-binding chemotaxis protein CheW